MSKKMKTVLDIIVVLAGLNYWFSGYSKAGIILCGGYAIIRFIKLHFDAKLEAVFLAMIQFTLFCLFSALMMKKLIQSSFLVLYFLIVIIESISFLDAMIYKNSVFYKRLKRNISIILFVFGLGVIMVPSEMISYTGYSVLDIMNKSGLIVLSLITFYPYLIIPAVQQARSFIKPLRTLHVVSTNCKNVVK